MRVDMDRWHNAAVGAGGAPGVAVLCLCAGATKSRSIFLVTEGR